MKQRLYYFFRYVWRIANSDEGDNTIQAWLKYRITIKIAWELSKILTDKSKTGAQQ